MSVTAPVSNVSIMDAGPISGLQVRTLLLCCLVAVLDGNDTQIMGVGAPYIAAALHVPPSAMGWALSGSWLGAAAGALVFGRVADKFGRKPMLLAAVFLFSVFTSLTPLASTLTELTAYRILTGIGLGGATPCFIALASEYAPARLRGSLVSAVWAAFPLGLLVGGLSNGWMLTKYEWPIIFYVGGVASLLLVVVLAGLLPESLAFLLIRERDSLRTRRILAQVAPGYVPTQPVTVPSSASTGGSGLSQLTASGRLLATLCIWVILFACFGTTASMSWIPTILLQHGVSGPAAAVAVSSLGLGALLGMVVAGRIVDLYGAARGLVVPMIIGAGATAAAGFWPASPTVTAIFVGLVGALVGMGASGGIALTALVYPIEIRSTGAGWGMGLGRLGQFAVPAIFAVMLGAHWATGTIFLLLAILPLIGALAALFVQRRHVAV